MKVAIMQPYIFPYIGYFQLIDSSDVFVFYDDVAFIKNGWIDRNRILVNGEPCYFKIPLLDASSFRPINKTEINYTAYEKWFNGFKKTLEFNYKKCPNYNVISERVLDVLNKRYATIAELAIASVKMSMDYIGLKTTCYASGEKHANIQGGRQDRLIGICKEEKADSYINPVGGADLYNAEDFKNNGLDLLFLTADLSPYNQRGKEFVPGLSIVDVMMHLNAEEILTLLKKCTIVKAQ